MVCVCVCVCVGGGGGGLVTASHEYQPLETIALGLQSEFLSLFLETDNVRRGQISQRFGLIFNS